MDPDEDFYEPSTENIKNFFAKLMTSLFYSIEYKLFDLETSPLIYSGFGEV